MNVLTSFTLFSTIVATLLLTGCATTPQAKDEPKVYEMRTYYSPEGKLDDLHARFRDHTMQLFEKHGIRNVGYWVPANNTENKLVFLLAYPSRAAREVSWQKFVSDPEWKAVQHKSEANGRLVAKVDQVFLQPTDYSPALKTGNVSGKSNGIFELRTYTTPAGLLPNLDDRFRNHTMKLFAKHGMKNWIYFHKTADQPGADTSLIYFLTHKSADAAKASFDAFRKNPAWVAAKTKSEINGSLTVPNGVKSEILVPTDYSPSK